MLINSDIESVFQGGAVNYLGKSTEYALNICNTSPLYQNCMDDPKYLIGACRVCRKWTRKPGPNLWVCVRHLACKEK